VHDVTEDPELSESDSDFDSEDEDVDEEELVESDAEEDNCAHYASPDLTPIPVVAAAAAAAAAVFSSSSSAAAPSPPYATRRSQRNYDRMCASLYMYSSSDERDMPPRSR
jgi:hypothetical protein